MLRRIVGVIAKDGTVRETLFCRDMVVAPSGSASAPTAITAPTCAHRETADVNFDAVPRSIEE